MVKPIFMIMALIGATVLGGLFALLMEWTVFRTKPSHVPVFIETGQSGYFSSSPLSAPSPYELESKIKINRCVDLYSYVCTLSGMKDPTGVVRRESEGEVEVLRTFESIVRAKKKVTISEVDEELVSRIYSLEITKQVRDLFHEVRDEMLSFIDSQPFKALSLQEKELLKSKILSINLELPPPATVYDDERSLFTKDEIYYEKTKNGIQRIRIGGALFVISRSRFNLAFTLAHELAHSIDPCELKSENIDVQAYHGLSECFGASLSEYTTDCKQSGKLSETFSDWFATHVVVRLLDKVADQFTKTELRAAIYNSVRDLCNDSDGDEDDPSASEGLSASHPSANYRVNRIFAQHPKIRKYLGCKDSEGPDLPGVPSYCYWR